MRLRLLMILVLFAFAGAGLLVAPHASQAQDDDGQQDPACALLSTQPFIDAATAGADLGENSGFVGYPTVTSVASDGGPGPLAQPGDTAALSELAEVSGSAPDPATEEWGYFGANLVNREKHAAAPGTLRLVGVGEFTFRNVGTAEPNLITVPTLTASEATVYAAPGTDASVVATLPAGTAVLVDVVTDEFGRILVDGVPGWVELAALEDADFATLPTYDVDEFPDFSDIEFTTAAGEQACGLRAYGVFQATGSSALVRINGEVIYIAPDSVFYMVTFDQQQWQAWVSEGSFTAGPGTPGELTVFPGTVVTFNESTPGRYSSRIGEANEWDEFSTGELIQTFERIIINPDVVQPSFGDKIITERDETRTEERFRVPRPFIEFVPGGEPLARAVPYQGLEIDECAICTEEFFYNSDADLDQDGYRYNGLGTSDPDNNVTLGDNSTDIQLAISPGNEYGAWVSDRDPAGGLEIMVGRTDGTGQQFVTRHTAQDINPIWLSDGSGVVFESNRDGVWRLYLFNVATGDLLDVTPAGGMGQHYINATIDPSMGTCEDDPDNREYMLYFQAWVVGADGEGQWEIMRQRISRTDGAFALAGDAERLTDNDVDDIRPVVSSDGSMIAFMKPNAAGSDDMHLMDAATLDTRQITNHGANVGIAGIAWSPDDALIAYDLKETVDGFTNVFVVSVDDDTVKQVTPGLANYSAASWLCSTSELIFHSDAAARITGDVLAYPNEIFVTNPMPMDAPSPAPEQLTFGTEDGSTQENSVGFRGKETSSKPKEFDERQVR